MYKKGDLVLYLGDPYTIEEVYRDKFNVTYIKLEGRNSLVKSYEINKLYKVNN